MGGTTIMIPNLDLQWVTMILVAAFRPILFGMAFAYVGVRCGFKHYGKIINSFFFFFFFNIIYYYLFSFIFIAIYFFVYFIYLGKLVGIMMLSGGAFNALQFLLSWVAFTVLGGEFLEVNIALMCTNIVPAVFILSMYLEDRRFARNEK